MILQVQDGRIDRWVEKKLEAKLGPQYDPGKTLSSWHVRRIYQERKL